MWTKPEDPAQVRDWRRRHKEGTLLVPRIAAVGTLVDGPAGSETTSIESALPGPAATTVATPEEARQLIQQLKAAGIDFVRTYSSLSREVYRAIAVECRKRGIPFAGHVPFVVHAAEASAVGQRSMEHLNQILESASSKSRELFQVPGRDRSVQHEELMLDTFDEARFARLLAVLVRNETWQVPTLVNGELYAFQRNLKTIWSDSRLRYLSPDETAAWKQHF